MLGCTGVGVKGVRTCCVLQRMRGRGFGSCRMRDWTSERTARASERTAGRLSARLGLLRARLDIGARDSAFGLATGRLSARLFLDERLSDRNLLVMRESEGQAWNSELEASNAETNPVNGLGRSNACGSGRTRWKSKDVCLEASARHADEKTNARELHKAQKRSGLVCWKPDLGFPEEVSPRVLICRGPTLLQRRLRVGLLETGLVVGAILDCWGLASCDTGLELWGRSTYISRKTGNQSLS
ncbi:hypothetical protein CRG98_039590 [Punica granatum]|uniref:Uncharacterized protein n=1 Tax=Punica granatum TaxID=22663 RepID=A0A2I0I8N2_PUNGR|nr:hypothetical protein CRG98_039590 [Punica granatum]